MNILVIDDEKPTLSMFRLFLTAYGYDVHIADDGEQGLEIFKDVLPEIVFTDLRMPGIDGIEVLRKIRKINTTSQVIIITGHGDIEKAMEALDLGASDFINKPVERQALNAALERAEKRSLQEGTKGFKLTCVKKENTVEINLQGKLSSSGKDAFASFLKSYDLDSSGKVVFSIDQCFSIDSCGIALLTESLQTIRQRCADVRIKGLSYNYLRFFQMAGIEKIAVLEI